MSYTLGQAAKATGKNKATIFQALKSGRISGTKDDSGHYAIDPAELHRIYPPVSDNGEKGNATKREQTLDNGQNNGEEVRSYKEKVVLLERLVEQITSERDRLLLLLPKAPEPSLVEPPPPSFSPALLERLEAIERQLVSATVLTGEPAPKRGLFSWMKRAV